MTTLTRIRRTPAEIERDAVAERRLRWRRRLLWIGLLPILLLLLVSCRIGVLLWHDHAGRAAYAEKDAEGARSQFAANARWNPVVERWISPYDEGTAAFGQGEYDDAVRLLERALPLAPPPEECRVRINLALSHEALAKTAIGKLDLATVQSEAQAGRQVLAEGGCLNEVVELARAAGVDLSRFSSLELTQLTAGDLTSDERSAVEGLDAGARARARQRAGSAGDVDQRLAQLIDQRAALLASFEQQQQSGSGKQKEKDDPQLSELKERNRQGEQLRQQDSDRSPSGQEKEPPVTW
ncbi:hypothetical protein [Nocardioides acrostichi]|uniref:Tetratricopeptide repeat protein n=1 Tax=Nocardioides acrostichi TaxID=2784339 RepID=A0A930Y807_9ACTN|nr:hypothetical protein [Nocardioides acrostichi]MBF4164000.1 hypothetical protein [Nocardioides acrostichi]